MSSRAYVLILSEKGEADTVAAEMSGRHGILTVNQVFGRYDVVALIEADDLEGLVAVVRHEVAPLDHVVRTETLVLSSAMKPMPKS